MQAKLILTSTSSYRSALLSQLGLPFEQIDPQTAEIPLASEEPLQLARRLGREKAQAGAALYAKQRTINPRTSDDFIFIGSDQVAYLGTSIFPKPGNLLEATKQLKACSGQWLRFSTSLCLVNAEGHVLAEDVDSYDIQYRHLSDSSIQNYLEREQPFDCAGSIKAEGLGVSLISEGRGKDINTLYGLPLILLVNLLSEIGFDVLNNIHKS